MNNGKVVSGFWDIERYLLAYSMFIYTLDSVDLQALKHTKLIIVNIKKNYVCTFTL